MTSSNIINDEVSCDPISVVFLGQGASLCGGSEQHWRRRSSGQCRQILEKVEAENSAQRPFVQLQVCPLGCVLWLKCNVMSCITLELCGTHTHTHTHTHACMHTHACKVAHVLTYTHTHSGIHPQPPPPTHTQSTHTYLRTALWHSRSRTTLAHTAMDNPGIIHGGP